jgi:hypothetical protein
MQLAVKLDVWGSGNFCCGQSTGREVSCMNYLVRFVEDSLVPTTFTVSSAEPMKMIYFSRNITTSYLIAGYVRQASDLWVAMDLPWNLLWSLRICGRSWFSSRPTFLQPYPSIPRIYGTCVFIMLDGASNVKAPYSFHASTSPPYPPPHPTPKSLEYSAIYASAYSVS